MIGVQTSEKNIVFGAGNILGCQKKKWILVGFDQNLINFIRFSQKVTFCHFLTKNAFFSILIIF